MAVSSAAYKFLMVDIGESGRQSDGSVYYNIDLGFAIENDLINMPAKKNLPNSNSCLLYTSPSPRDGLLSRMPSSA